MADAVVVPQTDPLATGSSTSEGMLAKLVTYCASAIAVLGGIGTFVGALSPAFASVPQIATTVAVVGVVVAALTQAAYGFQRTIIKVQAIKSGSMVEPVTVTQVTADVAAANLGK